MEKQHIVDEELHCSVCGKEIRKDEYENYEGMHKIDLVINVPIASKRSSYSDILTDEYIIRRQAIEFNVPVITNLQLVAALVDVLKHKNQNGTSIRSLNEYMDDLPWKMW